MRDCMCESCLLRRAAPDMLAVLNVISMWCEAFPKALNQVDREQMERAIAKATGDAS